MIELIILLNQGLSRMGRQHIHFVEAMPPFKTVISGMRSSCQVAVYVDIKKALKGNTRFLLLLL